MNHKSPTDDPKKLQERKAEVMQLVETSPAANIASAPGACISFLRGAARFA
jgi:hypothetical protein